MPAILDTLASHEAAGRNGAVEGFDVSRAPIVSIIDDDESVRDALEDLVSSLGFVAHVFGSAEDFLRSSDCNDADCVITDLQMPGMSGYDLQCELKAKGRKVPMIFITAFPEPRLRDCVMAKGAMAFLEKPFDGRTLMRLIRDATSHEPQALRQ